MRRRILSTLETWADIPGWADRVDSIALSRGERGRTVASLLRLCLQGLCDGVKLWWLSRRYEAVITDSRLHVSVFGLLTRMTFWRKPRHLMFECLWQYPSGPLSRVLKTMQFRAALTRRSRGIVYARRERDRFSACFGIPPERFVFIPYHTTLRGFSHPPDCEQVPGRYAFAGGDTHRDYETLCQAVTGLDLRVVIAARDHTPFKHLRVPPNVEIITTGEVEFLHWMLHAYVNIVPLQKGTLRSAGQQTFLNAMAFATPVIVTDVAGGGDYIENWVNGVVVEAADATQLRVALVRLLNDPDLAARIGACASVVRDDYATERILNLCLDFLLSDQFDDPSCSEFLGR